MGHPKNYQLFQTLSKTDICFIVSQIYYIKLFGILDFFHLSTPPESKLATGLDSEQRTRESDVEDASLPSYAAEKRATPNSYTQNRAGPG